MALSYFWPPIFPHQRKVTEEQRKRRDLRLRKLSFKQKGFRYHNYFKRTGRYRFMGKNVLRLILVIGAFVLALWGFTTFVLDIDQMEEMIFSQLPNWLIFTTLFLSECFTGILPPDMYIIWAKTFPHPYLVVFFLAVLSYTGGIISWAIGTQIHRLKRVKLWVDYKLKEQVKLFRRYGGLVIFISALTPLPFSPVSLVAGMIEYPFRLYWLVALSRFLRFFLYAYFLYQVI